MIIEILVTDSNRRSILAFRDEYPMILKLFYEYKFITLEIHTWNPKHDPKPEKFVIIDHNVKTMDFTASQCDGFVRDGHLVLCEGGLWSVSLQPGIHTTRSLDYCLNEIQRFINRIRSSGQACS